MVTIVLAGGPPAVLAAPIGPQEGQAQDATSKHPAWPKAPEGKFLIEVLHRPITAPPEFNDPKFDERARETQAAEAQETFMGSGVNVKFIKPAGKPGVIGPRSFGPLGFSSDDIVQTKDFTFDKVTFAAVVVALDPAKYGGRTSEAYKSADVVAVKVSYKTAKEAGALIEGALQAACRKRYADKTGTFAVRLWIESMSEPKLTDGALVVSWKVRFAAGEHAPQQPKPATPPKIAPWPNRPGKVLLGGFLVTGMPPDVAKQAMGFASKQRATELAAYACGAPLSFTFRQPKGKDGRIGMLLSDSAVSGVIEIYREAFVWKNTVLASVVALDRAANMTDAQEKLFDAGETVAVTVTYARASDLGRMPRRAIQAACRKRYEGKKGEFAVKAWIEAMESPKGTAAGVTIAWKVRFVRDKK